MPFLRQQDVSVPTKDIMSWYFDEPQYDLSQPVYIDASNASRHYTGLQARSTIRKLVAGFRAAGLQPGDVVCLHSFNDLHYPLLVNGIIAAGGIFAGTNPSYTTYELTHAITTAQVKFFIVEPELLPNVLEATKQQEISKEKIFVFDNDYNSQKIPDGLRSWRWLLEHGEQDWVRFDGKEQSKQTTAARLFSSGTSGLPKAAVLSQWNFKAQHMIAFEHRRVPYQVRKIVCLPMFHVSTVPSVLLSPLRSGAQMYIMRRFDLEKFLAAWERHSITEVWCVPPVVISIIHSPLTKKYNLNSLRSGYSGGAPLDRENQAKLQALLGPEAKFYQLWAMTELTCTATAFMYPDTDDTGSVGYSLPGLDFKLVDDEGNDVSSYNKPGEMCVRGETVISGYLNNPTANESWDADGFFHTGDVMYCDEATKKWYVVDRKKELIKVRGFQVAPAELEAVLLLHPHVADAAVIGVPDGEKGSELPRAYLVRKSSTDAQGLSQEEVKKYMAERLAGYKRLDGGVAFVQEIPKTPSGKIIKRMLRETAAQEVKSKL